MLVWEGGGGRPIGGWFWTAFSVFNFQIMWTIADYVPRALEARTLAQVADYRS